MRLVGGFIMSMFFDVAGVLCGMGICVECMSIPGMSGMRGCLVCAWRKSAVDRRSGSKTAAGLWNMVIPSLDSCMVGNSVEERCEDAKGKRESDTEGYAGWRWRRRLYQACDSDRGGCDFVAEEGSRDCEELNGLLNAGGCNGGGLLLRGAAGGKVVALRSGLWTVAAGRLPGLLRMQARRCIEKQHEQTEERREPVQRFLHLTIGRFNLRS
jgi:hypothetical protein